MTHHQRNFLIYGSFLLVAFAGILYGTSIQSDHPSLRIWEYQNILMLGLAVPLLFMQTKASLPDFVEDRITDKSRFLNPLLIGMLFGVLDIIVIKMVLHPQPYTELPPFLQPFPYSIFLYFSGALEIEVFYRLIPLTLILLVGKRVADGAYFNHFLWTSVILTSIREPLEQLPDGASWYIGYSLLTGFAMNFVQAVCYKNAGFLASLTLRLGHYLFWHILLGIYVEYVELAG